MRIQECKIGQIVSMKDGEDFLVGDIVGLSRERVRVAFRNRKKPRPVSVHPRRLWATEDQLDLFCPMQVQQGTVRSHSGERPSRNCERTDQ
jgi:hypothetical protein